MFFLSRSHHLLLTLMLLCYLMLCSHVQASSVSCKSVNISSLYPRCLLHSEGVHSLDCFGKFSSRGRKTCVWNPGNNTTGHKYTLVVQQQRKKYCRVHTDIAKFSATIQVYEDFEVTVEVFENIESSTCSRDIFRGFPKSLLRCGPPNAATFRRHVGRLDVTVSWRQDDVKAIRVYSLRYKTLGGSSWNQSPVGSQNSSSCRVDGLNSSLVYRVQIQCVRSEKCSQCPWSDIHTVPAELTLQPIIIDVEDSDIPKKRGCRLISVSWKFPASELFDSFHVSVGKASGEKPREQMITSQAEIKLVLSHSDYHLNISAANNASVSPAVTRIIPWRGHTPSELGDGRLNVSIHSRTSFTISWRDNLIKSYVCYSAEWRRRGHRAAFMSFYQSASNHRTLSQLPEALEAFRRYTLTLHTRPNKDTCDLKHINNTESSYGTTQFYLTEGVPISAPTNISSSNVTLNSALLQWSSIPEDDLQGFLLGYTIHYSEYQDRGAEIENNITVDPESNSFELRNLKSGTAYRVHVSGFTSAGAGVRSMASFFETNHEGSFNLSVSLKIFAVVATALIFGSPVIKRAKVVLWPNVPNPRNSNMLQKIDRPGEPELLQVEERETEPLQVVEAVAPSAALLLHQSEDEADSLKMSPNWTQSDTDEDKAGDILPEDTMDTFLDTGGKNLQSSLPAFSSDYTTMEMFQQVNAVVTMENKVADTDGTVVKSQLDYVRQVSTSPSWDSKHMSTSLG